MKSIQKINVDISRDRNLSEPSVYAKQNDSNSREVEVTLCDNGVQLSSLTTTGKVFFGKGANAYAEAIEISNGVTEFTIPQNALSSPGRIQAEILILNADDDTETLTSASFVINCRTQINPSGSIDGENNGDYIEQIVDDLQSQIDALGGVDVSELQADIDTLKANTLDSIGRLSSKDNDLQSQIDALEVGDVTSVNGKTGEVTLTGEDILVSKFNPNTLASLGNYTNFNTYQGSQYATHLKLGTFKANDTREQWVTLKITGGQANYNRHSCGFKVLTLASSANTVNGGTYAFGTFYDFVSSDSTPDDIDILLVHQKDTPKSAVDVFIQFNDANLSNRLCEYFVTVEHSVDKSYNNNHGWTTDPDTFYDYEDYPTPTSNADWATVVPKVKIDINQVQTDISTLSTAVSNLQSADTDLQSQITAEIANRQSADTNLQSQLNTKATREVAIVGSDNENSAGWYKVADGTMPNLNDVSMLFAVHSTVTNKQYAGILQLNLRSDASGNITCPQLGWLLRNGFEDGQVIVTTDGLSWAMYFKVTSPRYYRTFFEVLQKSDRINSALKNYNLYTNSTVETTAPTATFASTDLGSVHQAIADLTARIEALEENSSGGVSQAVLIDWDVNTNGTTQGTVTKDAKGLHASGSTSIRIANYWRNDASAYDGITFTAYGSGKLRVEVGGVEGSYVVLSTTPTTFTFDFAENGLTDLSSVEINLQTQGAYDLTVSDIYGYTNL